MEETSKPLQPFSSSYTSQLPELLLKLKATIAITTYQAGKVVFIGAKDENFLTMLPRTFQKPMGMDVKDDKLVLATKDEVILFQNSPDLAAHYPNKPNTYDSLWIPRVTFYTGQVDMHDIKFSSNKIYSVNTSFSCLCEINGTFNFVPVWQPHFIDKLASEDRCHLNGLVMLNDKPKYVTALGATNTPQGWRDNITGGGILMDVETNSILLNGLAMPHSPMMYNGELYLLLSASGQLVKVNVEKKSYEVIKELDGFCRGMDIIGDYAFIGMSKLRKNSSTFAKLPFADKAVLAGIKVVHIPTKAMVAEFTYQTSVDEIYEVKVLANSMRPNILNTENPIHKFSLAIPGSTFWANPDDAIFKK